MDGEKLFISGVVATIAVGVLLLGVWAGSTAMDNHYKREIRKRGYGDYVLNKETLKVEFLWNDRVEKMED